MSGPLIEFHTRPEFLHLFPKPYPASRSVPDWVKNMPADSGEDGVGTLKRCQPFLDAMTGGYIIPFPIDMLIATTVEDGNLRLHFEMANVTEPMVYAHPPNQMPGAPFSKYPLLKITNPWSITTPAGYSCLFTAPVNRFDSPLVPLTGVVDTDVYHLHINIPAVSLLPPGGSIQIKAGTPLVQVLPFKRENWQAHHRAWHTDQRDESQAIINANPHAYREHFWRKKTYV